MHIPKTAGTSVRTLLESQLGSNLYPCISDLSLTKREWYDLPEILLEKKN